MIFFVCWLVLLHLDAAEHLECEILEFWEKGNESEVTKAFPHPLQVSQRPRQIERVLHFSYIPGWSHQKRSRQHLVGHSDEWRADVGGPPHPEQRKEAAWPHKTAGWMSKTIQYNWRLVTNTQRLDEVRHHPPERQGLSSCHLKYASNHMRESLSLTFNFLTPPSAE